MSQFDMSRATLKPSRPLSVFILLHNGHPIPGAEHLTRKDALVAAWQLSKLCGTAIECFKVEQRTVGRWARIVRNYPTPA